MTDKKKIHRARAKETIEDLHADDMLTSGQPWHKPRKRKKKESEARRQAQANIEKKGSKRD